MLGHLRLLVICLVLPLFLSSCGSRYLVLKDGRAIECDRVTYSTLEDGYICRSGDEIFLVEKSLAREEAPIVHEATGFDICTGAPGRIPDEFFLGGLHELLGRFLETAPEREGATVLFRFSGRRNAAERAMAVRLADSMDKAVMAAGFNFSDGKIRDLLTEKIGYAGTGCRNGWKNLEAAVFFGVELLICTETLPQTGQLSLSVWDIEKGIEVYHASTAPSEPRLDDKE